MANSIEGGPKGVIFLKECWQWSLTADIIIITVKSKVHIHVYMKLFLKELKKLWKYR